MKRNPLLLRVLALLFAVGTAALLLAGVQQVAQAQTPGSGFDCTTTSGINLTDCVALVSLYDGTGGPTWFTATNWTVTTTPCAADGSGWFGVSCSNGRVTSLLLQDNNLSGSLPPMIAALSELQLLGLSDNELSGPLPSTLVLLNKLEGLFLARNRLQGSIPEGLGGLLQLQSLYLNGNMFSGSVPDALCALVTKSAPNPQIINFDLGFNVLRIDNAPACFAAAGFDWRDTQTVPPEILEIDTSIANQITLRWEPISFTESSHPGSTGGYEVFMTTSSGVYGPDPERRTTTRTISEATFTNLQPGATYYFRMRTQTNPFAGVNKNLLHSQFTREVSDDTVALNLVGFQAGAADPGWLLWGTLLVALLFVPPIVAFLVRRFGGAMKE